MSVDSGPIAPHAEEEPEGEGHPVADPERFGEVSRGKLAARVARQIERDIIRGGWQVGGLLGSESELRERYQVSRAVMREAIRLVEHHQVAIMRRGPSGGLVVRAPTTGAVTSAVVVYLEFAQTTLDHVLSARSALEPLAAALAAKRVTESGLAQLRELLAAEAARGAGWDAKTRWRLELMVAELSRNSVLRLFIDVLLRLTRRYSEKWAIEPPEPALLEAQKSQQAMADAVIAGDSANAEICAVQYLESLREYLCRQQPLAEPRESEVLGEAFEVGERKLAEVVAERILAEIAAGGWQLGSLIGSEAALQDRFEVSRSVLREAVRLLEYHRVAQMRRGPGGGLLVTKPDPAASIETIALHLDFQGVCAEDLWTVREALELSCLYQVAGRVREPSIRRLLCAGLSEGLDGQSLGSRRSVRQSGALCDPWHVELAELSANPVLSLFLRILTTLAARQSDSASAKVPIPRSAPPEEADIQRTHQSVVNALLDEDECLAQHRMRRHLRQLARQRPGVHEGLR